MFVSLPIHECPSLCPSGITGMSSVASPSKDFTIPEGVHVMLIEYARSDAEFQACLADEPSLQQCLDEINRAGHGVHREATDPKLYVERDLVVPITNKLTKEGVLLHGVRVFWQGLKCRHVIASEAYYSTVQSTVANLRKKCKARVRCEVPIDLTNDDVSDETAASGSMQLQEADAMAACATTDRVTGNQPETQTKPEISQLGCGHAMDNEGSSESAAFKLQEAKKWMAKQYYPMRSKSLLQYNDDQVDRLELPHVRSLMKGAHVLLSSADGLWTETTFREFDDQRNCVILEYWNEMLGRIIQRHHEIPELAVPKQPKDSPPPAQEPEIRRLSCGHAVNNKAEHCPVCVRHFNELEQELAFQVANGAPPRSVPRAEWTELDETIIREMQAEMLPKMQAKKRKLIPEEARRRVQRKRD